MKKRVFIFLGVLLFLTACSKKSHFFTPDAGELSAVMHTKKGQLYSSLQIKASITATYLNAATKKFKKSPNEMFLVSLFIDADSTEKSGLFNESYTLTLNSKKAVNIKKLKYEDDLIKIAPIRNRWSSYYLVEFKKDDSEKLKMIYKNEDYGVTVLEYSKEFL